MCVCLLGITVCDEVSQAFPPLYLHTMSIFCFPDITALEEVSQTFPFCNCILEAINTEDGNVLEMMLGFTYMYVCAPLVNKPD